VLHSDLFSALSPDERFDLIFWNSNFVETPADAVNETDLHHAFFDPAYRAHRRFVREGPAHLSDGGRLMLGFCSIGNAGLLARECAKAGLRVDVVRAQPRDLGGIELEFQLLKLRLLARVR
jgi:release factor glutamine methyltransferase